MQDASSFQTILKLQKKPPINYIVRFAVMKLFSKIAARLVMLVKPDKDQAAINLAQAIVKSNTLVAASQTALVTFSIRRRIRQRVACLCQRLYILIHLMQPPAI
jgi:hypothetical protein